MAYTQPVSYTPGKLISAATTNLAVLKASPGVLGHITITNNGAGLAYVKLYDKATNPVLATDVPFHTFEVPNPGSNPSLSGLGINFANGLAIAITGGPADTDATAVAAAQVIVNHGTN